jgi:DNA processing protein
MKIEVIRQARLQLFDVTHPGDVRVAERIHSEGIIAVRDSWSGPLRDPISIEEEITQTGAYFISPESESWPSGLNDLLAPPIGLIVRGSLPLLTSISIVGTRNPTHYGLSVTRNLSTGLTDHGFVIVSGGALGIDTEAHRSALESEGLTIAIIASGVDIDYPTSNKKLFQEIAQQGAIVSEVMPRVTARPERFLTRNRLIAALSSATIVVEAAHRSGSLRTANDAAELLRPVFAVPGPITSPSSEGCHRLIANRSAEIITSVSDVIGLISPL